MMEEHNCGLGATIREQRDSVAAVAVDGRIRDLDMMIWASCNLCLRIFVGLLPYKGQSGDW